MTDHQDRRTTGDLRPDAASVADDVRAAREEYADEEAEASELEAAQNAAALDVPLSLRITRGLDTQLRQRAATERISPSALVRRILHDSLHQDRSTPTSTSTLSADQIQLVEQIARRVLHDSPRQD